MDRATSVQLGIRRSAEMAALFRIGDGMLGLLRIGAGLALVSALRR